MGIGMRSVIFRVIATAAFCWAVFGLLSLLSEFKFLVDGLDWSISHWGISYRDVLLEIGKRISQAVSGYREFVRSFARLLHLPHLPSFMYDVIGVVAFSIGRGYSLGQRGIKIRYKHLTALGIDPSVRLENEMHHRKFLIIRKENPFGDDDPSWLRQAIYDDDKKALVRQYYRKHPLQSWYKNLSDNKLWMLPKFLRKVTAQCLVYGGAVAIVILGLFSVDYAYRHFV